MEHLGFAVELRVREFVGYPTVKSEHIPQSGLLDCSGPALVVTAMMSVCSSEGSTAYQIGHSGGGRRGRCPRVFTGRQGGDHNRQSASPLWLTRISYPASVPRFFPNIIAATRFSRCRQEVNTTPTRCSAISHRSRSDEIACVSPTHAMPQKRSVV
jgi:hypothetical protein